MLICTAIRDSSPWHNFVSNENDWVVNDGETPCINNGGIYGAGNNKDFMVKMIENGAKNVFWNTKNVIFEGSPSLSNK